MCTYFLPQMKLIPKDVTDYYTQVVTDVMEYRENNNIIRKDYFQLLLQLKNLGFIEDNDPGHKENNSLPAPGK